jgi:NAD(P)-dependent dehydrogenase (short-subunit alcohol dehydrogenase family)
VAASIAVVVGVGPKRGLGAALSRRFAQAGLKVYISGRSQDKIAAVAKDIIANGGSAVPFALDATSEADVIGLFRHIVDNETGQLAIVACNVDSNQRLLCWRPAAKCLPTCGCKTHMLAF